MSKHHAIEPMYTAPQPQADAHIAQARGRGRLLAERNELLEALEEVIEILDEVLGFGTEPSHGNIAAKARAAIAAAKENK